jgi:site-specific DNA recombinase
MRALIYSRVSTDAQERDGTSLDTQERACVELALAAGWQVVECIRDAASGYTLERQGIERVRQLLLRGSVDRVVVYAVDRLSRNQNHIGVLFEEVQQADARLEVVTERFEDTAIGRFILAARAFTAEVEREKIAERTMRGKRERARSGRIPQAMGRGCYGYTYDQRSGARQVDELQAEVVRRIFRRYNESRSFSSVSNELNDAGIPALGGGRWYPLTIRRILLNESYAGRLYYGRTRWVTARGPNGKRRRRPTAQNREEWIAIEGASPPIVDEATWQRTQTILADPERIARRPEARHAYPLRGRLKCDLCGSAMVGQTMNPGTHDYHYYVCRIAFDRRQKSTCSARNVRADRLEDAIWRAIQAKLSDPRVICRELEQRDQPAADPTEIARVDQQLAAVIDRERRLVRLFSYGEIDETVIHEETSALRRQRQLLQDRRRSLKPEAPALPGGVDEALLARACGVVTRWLDEADDSGRALALEAMQIAIRATREFATVTGTLPLDLQPYVPESDHADARRKMM